MVVDVYRYSFCLTIVCLFVFSHGLELQPVRPHEWRGLSRETLPKRDSHTELELQNFESFLWDAPDGPDLVLGNFTVHAPGETEYILSMERFEPMLDSIHCSSSGMTLKFVDDESFAYAQGVWDWVNGADDHEFLMVAGAGDCGYNKHRVPYLISALSYNEQSNSAFLKGRTGEWKDLVHAYELDIGKVPMPEERKLALRDADDSETLSVTKVFPFNVEVEVGKAVGRFSCEDCGLGGNLNLDMHIKYGLPDVIDQAVFHMNPENIIAKAHPKLEIGVQKKSGPPITWDTSVLPAPLPLYGITLGGIVNLGVFVDYTIGLELSFEGTIAITAGATATIPNSAYVEIDFKRLGDGIKKSPWTPKVDVQTPDILGQASGVIEIWGRPDIKLEASALDFGYEAAFNLKLPYFEIKSGIEFDDGGYLCKDQPEATKALFVNTTLGAELGFQAGQINGKKPVDVNIATLPLWSPPSLCIPLDSPANSQSESKQMPGPTPDPTLSISSTVRPENESPATPSCTAKAGDVGTCIDTNACTNQGGYHEAGHCPGGTNIQCCTYPEGSGNYCTAKGVDGTCMPTASCPGDSGISIPGYCDGPADVQCCVSKSAGEKASSQSNGKEICSIDKAGLSTSGFVGECMATADCASNGGTSTPGFCSGGTDNQCCTYGACSGMDGVCEPVSTCQGQTTPGHCGGGKDIQCCTPNWDTDNLHPGVEKLKS